MMATRRGAWTLFVYTLIGTALGAVGGTLYSRAQSQPASPFQNSKPGEVPAAQEPPNRMVDPILVVDGALCGLVLGAGAGALALRGPRNA